VNSIRRDFPFQSRYIEILGAKMHYIDEGQGDPILFLHGNPTWSYLWRNIIPPMPDRCIAIDLMGMGRSDKPDISYRFLDQMRYVEEFIRKMKLTRITFVCHDWGAAFGLHYAMHHQEQVKGIALIEPQTLRPNKDWNMFSPFEAVELFQKLRDPEMGWEFMRESSPFIEGMTRTIINRTITEEEQNYYREPFKNLDDRKPMWVFPNEIPIAGKPEDIVQAVEKRNKILKESNIPMILFYATPGCTVRESAIQWCKENIKNLQLCHIGKGFHYLPEENPQLISTELSRWYTESATKL
jgi:haloalkane dehalogenase